jgi:hypothetical protein
MLTPRESTVHQLNGVDAINAHGIMVVGVKMGTMMWCTGFGIHANNNPKKARKFWHELIIPQGGGMIAYLCCGAERWRLPQSDPKSYQALVAPNAGAHLLPEAGARHEIG